ncbi:hypothetical protein C1H46_001727 [Malus baccata]|uniref:G domain-containing protein n=1 Tax=Malus baccata TaxID=106549 RepID=A0A540NNU8_MALBA|nr:hypothetical protein C1H46_001727 [Malus baccata]
MGVGKSTIMNELYGFDATSPGMLPSFAMETEEGKAMARHCSMGIEPQVSAERMSLSQPQTAANSLLPQLAIDASKSRQSSNASVPSTSFADSRLREVARTCNITVNLLLHHLNKFLAA